MPRDSFSSWMNVPRRLYRSPLCPPLVPRNTFFPGAVRRKPPPFHYPLARCRSNFVLLTFFSGPRPSTELFVRCPLKENPRFYVCFLLVMFLFPLLSRVGPRSEVLGPFFGSQSSLARTGPPDETHPGRLRSPLDVFFSL